MGAGFPKQARLPALILAMMTAIVLMGPLCFPSSYGLPGPETYSPPTFAHLCGIYRHHQIVRGTLNASSLRG